MFDGFLFLFLLKVRRCANDGHHYIPLSKLPEHTLRCSKKCAQPLSTEQRFIEYVEFVEGRRGGECDQESLVFAAAKRQETQDQTLLEELQRQRDLKRRRMAYRKRGVHTGNKSEIEVTLYKK